MSSQVEHNTPQYIQSQAGEVHTLFQLCELIISVHLHVSLSCGPFLNQTWFKDASSGRFFDEKKL